MRKNYITFLLLIITMVGLLQAQTNDYYYYRDQAILLSVVPDQIAVRFEQTLALQRTRGIIDSILAGRLQDISELYGKNSFLLKYNGNGDLLLLESLLTSFYTVPDVKAASKVYRSSYVNGQQIVLDEFITRFRDGISRQDIQSFNKVNGVTIKKKLNATTYLLAVEPFAQLTALQAANLYHDSGLTVWAAPNFIYPGGVLFDATVNDPF